MLRKILFLAITSGLAKKGWDLYRARQTADGPGEATGPRGSVPRRPHAVVPQPTPQPTHQRATTVGEQG